MYSRGLCLGFFVIDRRKRLPDPIGISRLIGQTVRLHQRHRHGPMLPARTRPLEFNARKNVRSDNTESLICIGDAQATTRKQAFAVERIVTLIDDSEIKRRCRIGELRARPPQALLGYRTLEAKHA